MEMLESHPFHVTRDADIEIQELEADDLLETTEEGVRQRRFGDVVRLLVGEDMPPRVLEILMNNLEVDRENVLRIRRPPCAEPADTSLQSDRPELKMRRLCPQFPRASIQARRGRPVRGDPPPRRAAAPSLRIVPAGDRFPEEVGARSERARHQDDAVSRRPQLADRASAAGGDGRRTSRWPRWWS